MMSNRLAQLQDLLTAETTADGCLDAALEAMEQYGFTSLIYDFTPVPIAHDGELITPSVLKLRNVPQDMSELWREAGYYQADPVQFAALRVSRPFIWSYVGPQSEIMDRILGPRHEPVVRYLKDTRMTCGVTVPIHLAGGGFATFTGIRIDPEASFSRDLTGHLPEIGMVGLLAHDAIFATLDESERTCRHVRLTMREKECLQLCADGLTAKEIAYRLDRSIATVTLHLNSATRKLGARNRFQAVARAAHYGLLEGHC